MNMTQEELAEKSEISRQSVCNIEQGKQKPSGRTLIEISKALGIQVEDLEGGGEGKRKQQRMENERLIEEGAMDGMGEKIQKLTEITEGWFYELISVLYDGMCYRAEHKAGQGTNRRRG